MLECSGRDIMTEVLSHMRIAAEASGILDACICIPCMKPFITSQFLPSETGDRPAVLPAGTHSLAFMGQFREVPDDVVFTVAYSGAIGAARRLWPTRTPTEAARCPQRQVRSARTAQGAPRPARHRRLTTRLGRP